MVARGFERSQLGFAFGFLLGGFAFQNRRIGAPGAVGVKGLAIQFDAAQQDFLGFRAVFETLDAHLLVLEFFVVFKELLQFIQRVTRQFADVAGNAKTPDRARERR